MEWYASSECIRYAWDQWLISSCEERGGHWWVLHGCDPEPEDRGDVVLACEHCPAGAQELDPEGGDESIVGNIRGVNIEEGVHDSHYNFAVPVRATLRTEHYNNLNVGYGCDLWIDVEERF